MNEMKQIGIDVTGIKYEYDTKNEHFFYFLRQKLVSSQYLTSLDDFIASSVLHRAIDFLLSATYLKLPLKLFS
jgi:hypothetical protein